MDKEVVSAKLEALRRCLQRIKDRTPASAAGLLEDYDRQDIICVNLERAVQTCVDLAAHIIAQSDLPAPGSMVEGFEQLGRLGLISEELAVRMKKAVGFRNVAVHDYQKLNLDIVRSILVERLDDFLEFTRLLLQK